MNPMEMAEWFSHDEWPMQFLDERWISKEETKFEKQPGFRWTRIVYDSLKKFVDSTGLSSSTIKASTMVLYGRLSVIHKEAANNELLISLHAKQSENLDRNESWQIHVILGQLYCEQGEQELSTYYLNKAIELAEEIKTPFIEMQTLYAIFKCSERFRSDRLIEHYTNYLQARDRLRALWLKSQLQHDLVLGPPTLQESLRNQKAFLLPEGANANPWWYVLLVLFLTSLTAVSYQLLKPKLKPGLPLNENYEFQAGSFKTGAIEEVETIAHVDDVAQTDIEIPVNDEKIELISVMRQMRLLTDDDWSDFLKLFDDVYKGYQWRLRLRYVDLTNSEIRLLCLLRVHMSSREIAKRLGISPQSVNISRYRIRSKLGLAHGERLEEFIMKV